MDTSTSSPAQPAPPPAPIAKTAKLADDKWGAAVLKLGYSIIPSLLLRAQQRLGLNPTQLAVLLQLCDFWWSEDRKPYPSKERLSERLGLKDRQIQRYLAELEAAGLVKRIPRYDAKGGQTSNFYDLSGLVQKLQALEPEFAAVDKENRERSRSVAMPLGRRRNTVSLPVVN